MEFKLNEVELKKAEDFKTMCNMISSYAANSDEENKLLTFHYIFSKSGGIGQSSAIECDELNIGISLTDYSAW